MAEETEMAFGGVERLQPWQIGVVGGVVGGLLMGALLTAVPEMRGVIEVAIPALWTLEGGAAGWIIHMINSAVFGVVFAAIAKQRPESVRTIMNGIVSGGIYGFVLWVVAAAFIMPVWLEIVGFASPPPLPNFNVMSLVAHLLFGVGLGAVFARLMPSPELY
jgi:hypothetical protein